MRDLGLRPKRMVQDFVHHSPHMEHRANSAVWCAVVVECGWLVVCVCVRVCVVDMMAKLADLVERRRQATKLTNRCHKITNTTCQGNSSASAGVLGVYCRHQEHFTSLSTPRTSVS